MSFLFASTSYAQQITPLNLKAESLSITGNHPIILTIASTKSMDYLYGIYCGFAIGISITILIVIWKWFRAKQKEIKKLKELNSYLVKTNNSLEKFANITSHNLRAPVVNLVSLTQMQKDDSVPEGLKIEIRDKIHQCAIQLDNTLNDLIEVIASKSETTKIELLNFEKEFDEVLKSIENQVEQSGLQLETNFLACPQIYFPKQFLNSIFLNLLTNSIKYKSGERKLLVRLKTEVIKGQTILHFSDNGMGMDLKSFGDKIFGLYQRFHATIEGKGMGLYIIKSQIEAMNGDIEVDSAPNEGTSFRIYFNCKKEG